MGFSGLEGTYYFKNFKLEKGKVPSPWCPNIADPLASDYGLDKIYDSSGFGNDGQIVITNEQYPTFSKDNVLGETSLKCYAGAYNITTNRIFYDNINQCHTVSFWYKKTSDENLGRLINFNSSYFTQYNLTTKQTLCYINGGDNDCYVYGSAIPFNEWTLVTWVFDHNNEILKTYYNGIENASTLFSNISQKEPRGFHSTTELCDLDGYVDDIRVYATVLSEKDILKLYQEREKVDNEGNLYCSELNEVERKVEYLESSGSQWIDTGIIPTENTRFYIKASTNGVPHHTGLFGSRNNGAASFLSYIENSYGGDTNAIRVDVQNITGNTGKKWTENEAFTIDINCPNKKLLINDEIISRYNSMSFTTTSEVTIGLFANHDGNNYMYPISGKIYYCQIWDNDTLVRDFLPMISTEEGHIGEACLFDTVENKYYYNQGTGKFTTNLDESTTNIDFTSKGIVNTDYIIEGKEQTKIKNDGNIIEVNNLYEN